MVDQPNNDPKALDRAVQLGHEPRDADVARVAAFGFGLLVLVAAALAFSYWLVMLIAEGTSPQQRALQQVQRQPMLRDEVRSNQHLVRMRQQAEQRRVLASYAWVDREQRIARIPIDRAIDVLARRGDLSPGGQRSSNSAAAGPDQINRWPGLENSQLPITRPPRLPDRPYSHVRRNFRANSGCALRDETLE